jgi:HD superfamily phosphodiesterase
LTAPLPPLSLPDAEALLRRLGAPPRLLTHARLVGEAASALLDRLESMGVHLDAPLVRLGVLFHDTGKILHPAELDGPGAHHEPAGQQLLLDHGVDPRVARCCVSHARWLDMECSLEELLVALADKLWKGVRHAELERRVIEAITARLGKAFWDVFVELDTAFEEIAAGGPERLEQSR